VSARAARPHGSNGGTAELREERSGVHASGPIRVSFYRRKGAPILSSEAGRKGDRGPVDVSGCWRRHRRAARAGTR
jgi:hypothetical protein